MGSSIDFAAIAELDLAPVTARLIDRQAGEGWSPQKARAVEVDYRRFLYLMKIFPKGNITAVREVDIFWRYHILDMPKYAADCQQVFGRFLHRTPGLAGAHEEPGQRRAATDRDPIAAIWSDARMIAAALAWSNFQGIDQPGRARRGIALKYEKAPR
jgi:hypothetical protein